MRIKGESRGFSKGASNATSNIEGDPQYYTFTYGPWQVAINGPPKQ